MTRLPAPDLSELQVFVFALALRPGLSRAQQRRFYSQMRRAMQPLDLMLCHHSGMCLIVPLGRQPARDFRQAVLGWLIDQHEPQHVFVHPLHSARHCLTAGLRSLADQNETLDPVQQNLAGHPFQRLLLGLLWLRDQRRAAMGQVSP